MNMTLYGMLSDYYTKIAGMVQAIESPQITSGFKKYLLSVLGVGAKLLEKVIRDFNERDTESLVIDVASLIDVQKALAMSVDNMPQQGQPGQPPPGGQPPPQGQPPPGMMQ